MAGPPQTTGPCRIESAPVFRPHPPAKTRPAAVVRSAHVPHATCHTQASVVACGTWHVRSVAALGPGRRIVYLAHPVLAYLRGSAPRGIEVRRSRRSQKREEAVQGRGRCARTRCRSSIPTTSRPLRTFCGGGSWAEPLLQTAHWRIPSEAVPSRLRLLESGFIHLCPVSCPSGHV